MIIKEPGKYRFTKDFFQRVKFNCVSIAKDEVIEISCVDYTNKRILGPKILEWLPWELPVKPY